MLGKGIWEFRVGARVEDESDELKQLPANSETREKAALENRLVSRSEEAKVPRTTERDL